MHYFNLFILQLRIARNKRLKRALDRSSAKLDLVSQFPNEGRYRVGNFDIVRFSRDGGFDQKKYFNEHPEIKALVDFEGYRRPPVQVARVVEHDPKQTAAV